MADASVTKRIGPNGESVLDFVLPRGPKGDKGDKGDDGANVLPTDTAIANALTTNGTAANNAIVDFTKRGKGLPIDVIGVWGQSNAQDKSAWYTARQVDVADDFVLTWNATTGTAVPVDTGSTYLGLYFAQAYRTEYPRRRVLLVPCAEGSSGLVQTNAAAGTWDRLDTSNPINLYTRALGRMNAALAWAAAENGESVVETRKRLAVLWSQGENDSRTATQAQYAAKLDDLITAFRASQSDTWNNINFVVGSMVPELLHNDPTIPGDVQYALEDTPRRVQFTSYVHGPKNHGKYNEDVHYSVQGQRVRGKLFVEGLRRARVNSNLNSPEMPSGIRVTRSGDYAQIEWEPAYGRVTAYEIQYSTDHGATWVNASTPRPLALSATLKATATLPFSVRMRAKNEVGTTSWTVPVPNIVTNDAYPAPLEQYRSSNLAVGAVTSWPSVAGSPTLTVLAGTATVALDGTEKVLTTNGTDTRLGNSTSPAWQTVSVLVKLPASPTGTDFILGPNTATGGYMGWDGTKVFWKGGTTAQIDAPLTGGGWRVITATIGAGGVASLSVDKTHYTGTLSNELPPAGVRIAGHFSSGQHIAASWARIAFWSRVLTAAEIEQWVDKVTADHAVI